MTGLALVMVGIPTITPHMTAVPVCRDCAGLAELREEWDDGADEHRRLVWRACAGCGLNCTTRSAPPARGRWGPRPPVVEVVVGQRRIRPDSVKWACGPRVCEVVALAESSAGMRDTKTGRVWTVSRRMVERWRLAENNGKRLPVDQVSSAPAGVDPTRACIDVAPGVACVDTWDLGLVESFWCDGLHVARFDAACAP